ncbi:MAG: hypothetical protein N2318_11115 [Meiothermus sp.]|nr:hypothetical protein [Meiothermus sp.]
MPRRTRPPHPGPESSLEDWVALSPPDLSEPLAEPLAAPPPAIAFFLQHANRSELAVAYKALVGLLVGGEEGLDNHEARVAREMYLALQRELDRRLHSAIMPSGGESPLPF